MANRAAAADASLVADMAVVVAAVEGIVVVVAAVVGGAACRIDRRRASCAGQLDFSLAAAAAAVGALVDSRAD